MKIKNKSVMEIHTAVLLFGLSGLFGKLLSLPPIIIVLGRVFFSSIFLLFIVLYLKRNILLREKKHYFYLLLMGILLAVHWTTFYKSIQVSTVAIGLLTFSTFPVFVTFLEPYFLKEKIKLSEVIIAAVTFMGVVLVVPKLQLDNSFTQGALWGILSGLTYAVLSMMNRSYVREYSSTVIAFYEQAIAAILLLPFLFLYRPIFQGQDILMLILLGTVFTGVSHSLFIRGLRNIKTQTAGIISSLEPVYGIIFAALLLREIPTLREVIGGIIILGAVFYSTKK
jgi:drug/metabolite transporter (DMT)-like permease